jgi:hypothetical protein
MLTAFSSILLAGRAYGLCSPTALAAVRAELRAAAPPACGTTSLRRVYLRARRKAVAETGRMIRRCARGEPANVAPARRALSRVRVALNSSGTAAKVPPSCLAAFRTEIDRLDADLVAAESGAPVTTTTTSPPGAPGAPTTTIQPVPCTTVTLEVDVGDCTRVTSVPRGLVDCDQDCALIDVTVPASTRLRLKGVPAPGDVGVTFDTDCNDDGTVPLDLATFPDCSLSCDCTSGH